MWKFLSSKLSMLMRMIGHLWWAKPYNTTNVAPHRVREEVSIPAGVQAEKHGLSSNHSLGPCILKTCSLNHSTIKRREDTNWINKAKLVAFWVSEYETCSLLYWRLGTSSLYTASFSCIAVCPLKTKGGKVDGCGLKAETMKNRITGYCSLSFGKLSFSFWQNLWRRFKT